MKTSRTETLPMEGLRPEQVLRLALQERCQRNPLYSLRSFARATGISHTVLSLVLSGKRKLSQKAASKLAQYLEFNPQQTAQLLKPYKKLTADDFDTLPLEAFEVISDWYHYAILSLLDLPEAQFEARWIAQQLGITQINAKMAMERLQNLGLVVQNQLGQWKQSGKPLKVENTISTTATKKFHKQLLQRAAQSIDTDPIPVRDFSSMTFVLDPSQVEYARQKLKDFRRELIADLESRGKPSAVYHLTMQLYPVAGVPSGIHSKKANKKKKTTQTKKEIEL